MSATHPSSNSDHGVGARADPEYAVDLRFVVPRLPRTYVPQDRLTDVLDRALIHPVTMITAPIGMGKTWGVAGWIRDRHGAAGVTWLTADDGLGADHLSAAFDHADRLRRADPGLPLAGVVVIDDAHRLQPHDVAVINDRLSAGRDRGVTPPVLLLTRRALPLDNLLPDLPGSWQAVDAGVLRFDPIRAGRLIRAHLGDQRPQTTESIIALARGWPAAVAALAAEMHGHGGGSWTAADSSQSRPLERLAEDALGSLSEDDLRLVYCIEADGTGRSVDAEASGSARAALLAGGLFVHPVAQGESAPGADRHPCYVVHPLLGGLIRRRLRLGGPGVDQVRTAVVRTVRRDLAGGTIADALQRLAAVGEMAMAADLLATHGIRIAVAGEAAAIGLFAGGHPDAVIAQPACWLPIALERWRAGDTMAAGHWMQMILNPGSRARPSAAESAVLHLLRSRIGVGSIRGAVDRAQQLVTEFRSQSDLGPRDGVMLPLLLAELGATQNWLGDTADAESNLTASVGICRSSGWTELELEAMSHLGFGEYLVGREENCRQLAAEVLGRTAEQPSRHGFSQECTVVRATLAAVLTGFVELSPVGVDEQSELTSGTVHEADLSTRFWFRIVGARLKLLDHLVPEAGQILTRPLNLPVTGELPDQLRTALLMETALVNVLAGDTATLKQLEDRCRRLDLAGEALLVAGFRADLAGDRRTASDLFGRAAERTSVPDLGLRAVALVCQAQLLDVLGESSTAIAQLREAIVETSARRNSAAFRGWSRQGTPVRVLLQRLNSEVSSPWSEELLAMAGGTDLITQMAMLTATPRERRDQQPLQPRPQLSARQHEVLRELARGSTYADIAANLFLSENTVKTHVTSLYTKLGVANRSQALATARSLQLL